MCGRSWIRVPPRIRIMLPRGATSLPAQCYFKHMLLLNNKQLDRTQISQLRNVFSNTCIFYTVLFQWASTIKIKLSVLVKYKADLPSLECNLFSPWYSWRIAYFALNSKYSVIQCNIRYLRALRKRYPFCLYNHGGILDFHFHNVHQYSSIYQKH